MEKSLTAVWPDRLLQTQSLTAALQATGAAFSVQVRFQGETHAVFDDERLADSHYLREVHLLLNDVPVIWARSVCAAEAQGWRQVLDCGQQPLGARLFDGTLQAERSPFEYLRKPLPDGAQTVWMRRSRFVCRGEILLLSEAFLPALHPFLT